MMEKRDQGINMMKRTIPMNVNDYHVNHNAQNAIG